MSRYTHQEYSSPGYPEATKIYTRRLEESRAPEKVARSLAYLGTIQECWDYYGVGTPQLAAAFYYYFQWLKGSTPRAAIEASLGLLVAERGFVAIDSADMRGTMLNIAVAILDNQDDPAMNDGLFMEVASRFAIALSKLQGDTSALAELNLGHGLYQMGEFQRAAYWLEVGLSRLQNNPPRKENSEQILAQAKENTDALSELSEYWQALIDGEFREAARLGRQEGPLWELCANVAELESRFDANRMSSLLDQFLSLLAEEHSLKAMERPGPELEVVNEPGEVDTSEPALADHVLLNTALSVRDDLTSALISRADAELADALVELCEAIDSLGGNLYIPISATIEALPLSDETRERLQIQLSRIRSRASKVFEDDTMKRTNLTAQVNPMAQSLGDLEIGDRTVIIGLQDLPFEFLREDMAQLDRFPNTIALYLFGNGLSVQQLSAIDFAALKNLQLLDLAENFLDTLPESVATHPRLERLSLSKNPGIFIDVDALSLPNLRYLDLRNCEMSVEAVQEIRAKLPKAKVLAD